MEIKKSIEKITPYAALISLIAALITIGTLFFAISIFFQNQPTVSILDCPPSVYGGEELNVRAWRKSLTLSGMELKVTRLQMSWAIMVFSIISWTWKRDIDMNHGYQVANSHRLIPHFS